MAAVRDELGGDGIGTHWTGLGLFCATGETVERLPCNTARVTEVDVLCAGLPSIATFLVESFRKCHRTLIRVGTGSCTYEVSYSCWHSSSHVGIRPVGIPGMVFFAAAGSRNTTHCNAESGSEAGLGSWLAAKFRWSVKLSQSALRKFHLLTGRVGTVLMAAEDSMMDGRCWDWGNWSRTRRLMVCRPRFAKARSGLVVVPQRAERKLPGCFRVMDQRQVSHGGPVFERRTIGVGGAISPCGAVTVKVSGVDTRLRVARQIIGIETGTWRFVHVRDCNTFHLGSGPLDLTVE